MSTFMIADTHFFDMDIVRFENRPFNNKEELNNYIIGKWNSVVKDEDEVFLLGDFSAGTKEEDIELMKTLKGTKYLVLGNHDTKGMDYYGEVGFSKVYDLPVLYKTYFLLSHEPLYTSSNSPYANIYGHVHMVDSYKDYSAHSFIVSCERIDYTPILFEDVFKKIKEQRSNEENEKYKYQEI